MVEIVNTTNGECLPAALSLSHPKVGVVARLQIEFTNTHIKWLVAVPTWGWNVYGKYKIHDTTQAEGALLP